MLLFTRFLFFFILVIGSVAEKQEEQVCLPACHFMTPATVPKYHVDTTCDRVAHNSPAYHSKRRARYQELRKVGLSQIPNQVTVVCPQEPIYLATRGGQVGQDTTWLVENKSSGKVVVAYVHDGKEYSAMNSNISPPQADSESILQPGEWKSISTFEGHVFYVREILADGSVGNILLQHRAGLIGFTNRFQKKLDCDDLEDVEPIVQVQRQDLSTSSPDHSKTTTAPYKTTAPEHNNGLVIKSVVSQTITSTIASNTNPETEVQIHPNYKRSPAPSTGERCNIVYQGFRNLQSCPLNVYYTGMQPAAHGPMECNEEFKFHLGAEDGNDARKWQDNTKFESTFVGHTFVARVASNPDIVVDTFTLQPTEIHDCPGLKQEPILAVIEIERVQLGVGTRQNATNMDGAIVSNNMIVNVATMQM
jgi:hypothetical protein